MQTGKSIHGQNCNLSEGGPAAPCGNMGNLPGSTAGTSIKDSTPPGLVTAKLAEDSHGGPLQVSQSKQQGLSHTKEQGLSQSNLHGLSNMQILVRPAHEQGESWRRHICF